MPKNRSPIDAVVGQNIYRFRRMIGVSQTVLGGRLNVSFQQVQKYEKGTNRITVGALVEVANALNVNVKDLLVGSDDVRLEAARTAGTSAADIKLARELGLITDDNVRRALRGLIKTLASNESLDEETEPRSD